MRKRSAMRGQNRQLSHQAGQTPPSAIPLIFLGSLCLSLIAGCTDTPDDDSSPTPPASPTASATASPTTSPTASPGPTPTASPTPGPTATPGSTATPGPTATPGTTATPGPTTTPEVSPTPGTTATPGTTTTPGATATPDITATPGPTPTFGPTPTDGPTPTQAPTPSPTATPTVPPTPSPTPAPDLDLDGFSISTGDCNDLDNRINPASAEVCDDLDNNCNEQIDEGLDVTLYLDGDSDGFGDPTQSQARCDTPSGYVSNDDDCDDTDASAFPGNVEEPSECDDAIDQDCSSGDLSCEVADQDGDGFSPQQGDCDDTNPATNPAAAEVCNGLDDNCQNGSDEGVTTPFYPDLDGDTFGDGADPGAVVNACLPPEGYSTNNTDCDDTDAQISPDGIEVCNGLDDDCNDAIDDDASDVLDWYADLDGDSFGSPSNTVEACDPPADFVDNALDCDDGEAAVNPSATEVCNDVDDNCDGITDPEAQCVSDAFTYRRPVDITNPSGGPLTDYQVGFALDTVPLISSGKMLSSCADIRVTDSTGTLLPHWVEKQPSSFACNGSSTRIWTRLASLPTTGKRLYVHYGNPTATVTETGSQVFLFFDDFSSQSGFDATWKKVANGTPGNFVVANGTLEIQGGATPTIGVAPAVGTNDYTVESDMYFPGSSTVKFTGNAGGVLARYNGTGNYYHQELDQNNLNLYLFTNFGYTLIAGILSNNSFNTWYRESLKVAGTQLVTTTQPQNGFISTSSTAYSAGVPALYRWDANVRFDNFRVRRAVVTEPTSVVGPEEVEAP